MRIAVLGLGSAGGRHARLLTELGHEVIGFDPVSSPPEDVRKAPSIEEAVSAAEAVVVASPSALHAEQARLALERGRHVLVEKPLAVRVADGESLVGEARRTDVVCGVAMNLRFHSGVLGLKDLLDQGALGVPLLAQASFGYDLRLWRPGIDYRESYSAQSALGGGIVFDAIHELDYLLWLLGPVVAVSAEVAHVSKLEIDVEDVAVVGLRFASGAVGAADLNFVEPAYRRSCLLVGSEAVARWDWSAAEIAVHRDGEDSRVIPVPCDLEDTYRGALIDFVAAVESGAEPRASAQEGLAALRVADAVKRSATSGRRIELAG